MKILRLVWSVVAIAVASTALADDTSAAYCERGRAALETARASYGFPGAVLAVTAPGGAECVVAVGLADLEARTPMQPDSRMLAASIGKTFVAAVTLRLAHDGALGLDDPVSRWLGDEPYFKRLPNATSMTVRHLLSHSSGLPDHVHSEGFAKVSDRMVGSDRPYAPEELVSFILDQPPLFEAGTGYGYTDTGYILLGLVIERAAKRPYYELAQEYFTRPLGLTLTSPSNQRSLPGLVPGYLAPDNPLHLPLKTVGPDGMMVWNPASEWTGGGFVSSARDLARWVRLEFSGKAATYPYLDDLLDGAPEAVRKAGSHYGLGVYKADSPYGRMLGHRGWIPGYVSAAFYLPEREMSYALQINSDVGLIGPDGNGSKINDALLEAILR